MTLVGGEIHTGEVIAVTSRSVTPGTMEDHGFEGVEIAASGIAKIEVEGGSAGEGGSSNVAGIVGVTTAMLLVALGVGYSVTGGFWDN